MNLPLSSLTFCLLSFSSATFAAPPAFIYLLPGNAGQIVSGTESQDAYCKRTKNLSYVKCHDAGISWSLPTYEAPKESAKKMGELIVTKLTKGLIVASYKDEKGKLISIPISNEDISSDKFELTVANQQGDWIQLPKRPLRSLFGST